jgi:hypothetical protein
MSTYQATITIQRLARMFLSRMKVKWERDFKQKKMVDFKRRLLFLTAASRRLIKKDT